MIEKFSYHGINITLDVYDKIQSVVEMIAEKESVTFDEAYEKFAFSNAYKALQNPKTLMWYESPGFIVDEYYREAGR